MKITVLGAGNMGTTVAHIISSNGFPVTIWNYEGDLEPLEQIENHRENKKYLPGIKLSSKIKVEPDLSAALAGCDILFYVMPSSFMDSMLKRVAVLVNTKVILVDVSKGVKKDDWEVGKKNLGTLKATEKKLTSLKKNMVTISGPAIAGDLARGGFTAMNSASNNDLNLKKVTKVLQNKFLKLLPSNDVRGVKMAGALKNVYAILLGLCDGLKFPMNTKAFFLTQALDEIGLVLTKIGGKKETVYSLAGLGDLIGTALCTTSRNRSFGEFLVYAETRNEAEQKVGQVVEGIEAAKKLITLGKKLKIKLPLAEMVYKIVWNKQNVLREFEKYLSRF
jgi:glycerol-3-phosphate dehydrogenase (NAD(P)+)